MGELTGTLIEMNAHTKACEMEILLTGVGVSLILVALIHLVLNFVSDFNVKWKTSLIIGILAIAGLVMALYGHSLPGDKYIKYCANGPVSIEQIAMRYDIVNIDGKEITVKERR